MDATDAPLQQGNPLGVDRSHDSRWTRLRELIETRGVLRGSYKLASGKMSSYYFDGKRVTHDPEGISLVGELVCEALGNVRVEAVGGPAAGANPIVTAVQIASYKQDRALGGFYVRSERKDHGSRQLIEGNLPRTPGARVAIVDDTVTTGGSVLRAIEAAEDAGCEAAKVLVIVDRRQGGGEALRARGYDFEALFEADEEGNIL